MKNNNSLMRHVPWLIVAIVGACALGVVALRRGEAINALWIVVAAVAIYLVAYRYYSLFIATHVMQLDPLRATPAVVNNDGLDYVPTNKHILFGHHFAAIAGAGPLVGPVLAAQMGYLPGTLWLIAGVVLAGAVQDFMILFLSTRRDGRSLGDMVREEMGRIPGTIALFGCFLIMIIILAVLALIVVKALAESPWGMFTVMATIPIAMFMGIYMRYIRPGRIGEISIIGVILLLGSIWVGGMVAADPTWGPMFTFTGVQITWMLVGYGFVAAMLPVWLLLAPRDYLSTFLKIGTILALAIGILILAPELKMPALTQFTNGTGPVWKGALFPFLFITIACGAVSGFHALISSGTTPKLLDNEKNARYIGYGGMLMESFVAIMAMVAASVIEPGVYFAMNSPAAVVGSDVVTVAQTVSSWGFAITPEQLTAVAKDIGENTVLARAGGAPTLAVGIAQILHQVLPGENTMAFWYHFAILFEALFILTAVDAGTRAGRFMLQDLLGSFVPALKRTESWTANAIGTGGCVALWGYLLYQGVIDPLGGINTLWPLFGISNQMLAGIALMLASVVLIKMKRQRYVWVTMLPATWLLICTLTAGLIKLFDANPAVGFLALAKKYSAAADAGQILAPAKTMDQMQHVIFNAYTNAGLTVLFLFVVFSILFYALKVGRAAWTTKARTDKEALYQAMPPAPQV
ncbi:MULTISPECIES: carbon starvation CstA family protein [Pseudomonas syringae group genomosp. 2]|uniref:carbon starvation CstA family protein n=1 Tax=Pseudomonas syringae group genomosp. 2 TaxID=251698 RepID=UPI0001CC3B0F|nr:MULTISPECIES: carbon starvation CstA family protein [Pseudomonas syringae group genomosp. 2]EGH03704.1 carbon starvation protein CstA [Pseudomonas amygdali pv. aesculi str. 0893_23]KPW10490.1 Carbon starvation protein CstA [Pseudomonas amygdali pv. aesculi]KWT15065.1 carbon starvation protein A [Pseudomonas amygdali pv. aesculi]KWT16003.1 carbon starvation protein A [Pseudomonas amygdali pv. aesculi]KWT21080.1 carbon starvation protein A [Pseudomonas amygdali pv. aesculi]